jgi:hypothetical protein
MQSNNENFLVASIGAIATNIASINGLDIIQSLLLAFAGGFFSLLGKEFYKKIKQK